MAGNCIQTLQIKVEYLAVKYIFLVRNYRLRRVTFFAAPCIMCLTLTDTFLDLAGQSLVPRVTVTNE